MPETYFLCEFNEVPDNGARNFTIETKRKVLDIFIVRKGENIYAYMNSCPHTSVRLNMMPDKFHNPTGKFLHCNSHGALFRIEDGYCVRGPCVNQRLQALNISNANGKLSLFINEEI
jgi:nitrite reductase/ring-hydroxylating ferredoxin subunit